MGGQRVTAALREHLSRWLPPIAAAGQMYSTIVLIFKSVERLVRVVGAEEGISLTRCASQRVILGEFHALEGSRPVRGASGKRSAKSRTQAKSMNACAVTNR
jgi:hypothetical protein